MKWLNFLKRTRIFQNIDRPILDKVKMKVLNTNDFLFERIKVKPITNGEWSKISQDISKQIENGKIFCLEKVSNPKKSDIRIGDFVITAEDNFNYYIIVDGKDINWMYVPAEWILVQSDGFNASGFIHLKGYLNNLKWDRRVYEDDYSIKHVFHTPLAMKDLMTEKDTQKAMKKCVDEIINNYPELEKELKI